MIREQRGRLDAIESEFADVRRRQDRLWHLVDTSDDDMSENLARIKANVERQKRLQDLAVEASAILSQRRAVRGDMEAIMARAKDMAEFLKESESSERRAFAETFIKEIVVMPGKALVYYTVPMADDSHSPGGESEELIFGG